MSALGHKQTFAPQEDTSALPPKADIKSQFVTCRDDRFGAENVRSYPESRHRMTPVGMSAKGQ
jgi:hypothetical protein